jgi:acylphosphatase
MAVVRRRIVVRGEVQGVGFRASARRQASELGLAGLAHNASDGSVEVELQGDESAVDQMTDWLRHGPRFARVAGISVTSVDPHETDGRDDGFVID